MAKVLRISECSVPRPKWHISPPPWLKEQCGSKFGKTEKDRGWEQLLCSADVWGWQGCYNHEHPRSLGAYTDLHQERAAGGNIVENKSVTVTGTGRGEGNG